MSPYKNILEQLADTNAECEIWWDASPLVYETWVAQALVNAPPAARARREAVLNRMFAPPDPTGLFFKGVTTNPIRSLDATLNNPDEWGLYVRRRIEDLPATSSRDIFRLLNSEIIRRSAQVLLPLWHASNGRYGHIACQVDPSLINNFDAMRAEALDLASVAPNVMVKCPGSAEGCRLIEYLTAMGIPTNATMTFTVSQHVACMDAVSRGLEAAKQKGVDLCRWRSVITHMSSRIGELGELQSQAGAQGITLSLSDIRWAEVAVFKKAYFHGIACRHPSKMLMCSMRIDSKIEPGRPSSRHIEQIAGGNVVYTCPPGYIAALLDIEDSMPPFNPHAIEEDVPRTVMEKLMRIPYFEQSFEYNGILPEEFCGYASFARTAAEFQSAARSQMDFVLRQFKFLGKKAPADEY
jgi:transaldolase